MNVVMQTAFLCETAQGIYGAPPWTSRSACSLLHQKLLDLWLRTAPNMLASAIPPLQYKKTCRITLPVQGFLSRTMINFLEAGQIAHTLNMELTWYTEKCPERTPMTEAHAPAACNTIQGCPQAPALGRQLLVNRWSANFELSLT